MRHASRRFTVVCLVTLAVVLVMAGCGEKESKTIKIGVVAPLTGAVAAYGEGARDGILLAFDKINAAGGILGKKIEPIVEDNKGDQAETTNVINKLISKDKVAAIVGPVISGTSNVAGPICNKEKIPMITPTATAVDVTKAGEYVSRVCFLDSYQGTVMAKFAAENLKAKTAAVLFDVASDYSIGMKDVFIKEFAQRGGKTVQTVSFTSGDSDFRAQLTKIKTAAPDVIYLPAYYNDDALVVRQAQGLGITVPFLGGDGWDAQELITSAGKTAEGCYFTTHYSASDPSEIVQNFLTDYQAKYKKSPIVFAALGYDAAGLLAAAIQEVGGLDPEEIKDSINSTRDYAGVTGKIALDANRNPIKDVTIVTVKNGAFELVTKLRP
jgi:branched-chain amino acid transport system substrate-binding protein